VRVAPLLSLLALLFLLGACTSGPSYHARGPIRPNPYGPRAAAFATEFIGIPYRYGGDRPRQGFDCSGLVQYSYHLAGLRVPRSTYTQYQATRWIPRRRVRPGDLLFFNQEGRRFSHVGIYIGHNRFVHAPSAGERVRVSTLDNPYWLRHLASIRRFLPW
jgi:murein DD-endopeptidase